MYGEEWNTPVILAFKGVEAEGSEIKDHPQLHSKRRGGLGMVMPAFLSIREAEKGKSLNWGLAWSKSTD